jgi:dipeptidyl aminopeptidase/acylaminoacyl peptidase
MASEMIDMSLIRSLTPVLFVLLLSTAGCGSMDGVLADPLSASDTPYAAVTRVPTATLPGATAADLVNGASVAGAQPTVTPAVTTLPTSTVAASPTPTRVPFEVGREITIEYLRGLEISGSEITFEQQLDKTWNYHQHLVSYISEGDKIYGLLTVPVGDPPPGGFKAIVFNHGYIPPANYRTTERYTAYVDYLARSGFVVFKIDYRGHGISEGQASGTYFSPGYTIDAIAALKSLQTLDFVDPDGIGMWGHSMAGNLVLRSMLVEADIKAGVIWAGAVYSYDDFARYGIDDNTYRPPQTSQNQDETIPPRRSRQIIDTYGMPDARVGYWQAVSLTENIAHLTSPVQLHHAEDDPVVNIGYSFDLAAVLRENSKQYEFFSYESGGHNLVSPYFDQAMQRTVEFFRSHL